MIFFFFNDTATTEIYTLSLHDALPIYLVQGAQARQVGRQPFIQGGCQGGIRYIRPPVRRQLVQESEPLAGPPGFVRPGQPVDRKSTRLNSSHANISYAVFCLKKKNITI